MRIGKEGIFCLCLNEVALKISYYTSSQKEHKPENNEIIKISTTKNLSYCSILHQNGQ